MSASAKNMESVYKAKDHHDKNCPWGGTGIRFLMHPIEIDRMGWEEGDVIAGMTLVSDASIGTGTIRVECDAEPNSDDATLTEAVAKEELVTA